MLRNRGGIERNNLNNFVQLYLDNEENETFPLSFYHDLETIETELIPFKNEFIILSLKPSLKDSGPKTLDPSTLSQSVKTDSIDLAGILEKSKTLVEKL